MDHSMLEAQFLARASNSIVEDAENEPVFGNNILNDPVKVDLPSNINMEILEKVYLYDYKKITGSKDVKPEEFPIVLSGFAEFLGKKIRQEEAAKTTEAIKLLESKIAALESDNKVTNNHLNTMIQNIKDLKIVEKPTPLVVETTPFDKTKFGIGFAELFRMVYLCSTYYEPTVNTAPYFHPMSKYLSQIASKPDAIISAVSKLAEDSSKGPAGFVCDFKKALGV